MKAQHVLGLALVGFVGLMAPAAASAQSGDTAAEVTFAKDIAPDPPAELPAVPPAGVGRPDVAPHLRGRPAVGARHQDAHRPAEPARRHAAVVRRAGSRHPAFQERSVAERGRDREDRNLGRQRRAARQPGRPAAAARVRRRERMGHRQARPDPGVAGGDRTLRRAGQVDLAREPFRPG